VTARCASIDLEQDRPNFDHLRAMTDERGVFEHADRTVRRLEHGYCTDDNARMLVVTARESEADAVRQIAPLCRIALDFTLAAQVPDGRIRNRMDSSGQWVDEPSTNDCWGRALWGLGVAARQLEDPAMRAAALAAFERGARQRSRWPRAMAFAAIGAADVLAAEPGHRLARALLRDAIAAIGAPAAAPWVWPEGRLRYANAALAEATIAAGAALEEPAIVDRGLAMLDWLVQLESWHGHLSVTGVGGRGRHELGPQFDQQPIEVAAIADACWRACAVTGDPRWALGVELAAAWFDGVNDTGVRMWDHHSGGGYDGLLVDGVNLNQGAESTLAVISTMQRARSLTLRSR